MIASVPYVPPDTMKNVAATRGQSVIFATLFFVEVKTWEGICAGRDTVLNFYSRPPKVTLAVEFPQASALFEEYKLCTCMQEKNAPKQKYFRRQNARRTARGTIRRANSLPARPVLHSASLYLSS